MNAGIILVIIFGLIAAVGIYYIVKSAMKSDAERDQKWQDYNNPGSKK